MEPFGLILHDSFADEIDTVRVRCRALLKGNGIRSETRSFDLLVDGTPDQLEFLRKVDTIEIGGLKEIL